MTLLIWSLVWVFGYESVFVKECPLNIISVFNDSFILSESNIMSVDWSGRWNHVQKFLERTGPFAHPDFEPSSEVR